MTAFGGMMSSRLFQNIREKLGLCYYIGARHNAQGFDGTFVIRAGVDKERFDFAVERIHAELDELVTHGITQEEFAIARDYRIGKMAMSVETSDQMADRFGEDYLIYNTLETLDHVKQKYMNLTLDDVNAHVSMLARDLRYLYYVC
jgi:predicted Zn-dependent peptidase